MTQTAYRANHKCEHKYCPGCKEFKFFPLRNTYCSTECARKKGTVSAPEETQNFSIDAGALISKIVGEVMRQLPPELLGKTPKPEQWKKNEFSDGWTVILSDIHIPYHHVDACLAVLKFLRTWQKDGILKRLILNGDIFDAAALSRHMKQRRSKFPSGDLGSEMQAGQPLINEYAKLFDETIFLGGNHEEGRLHRILANEGIGIPADPLALANLLKFYGYEGMRFVDRRDIKIGFDEGTVKVFHGEVYNKHTAATILEKNRYQNVAQGHTHRPQIHFSKGQFGLVNGNLLDKEKQDYMPDPDWTMGFSILEHFNNGTQVNPYFVKVNEDGEFSFAGTKYTSEGVKL